MFDQLPHQDFKLFYPPVKVLYCQVKRNERSLILYSLMRNNENLLGKRHCVNIKKASRCTAWTINCHSYVFWILFRFTLIGHFLLLSVANYPSADYSSSTILSLTDSAESLLLAPASQDCFSL